MSNRVVIKFGGADLSDGERIRKAAELVVKSGYKEKVVVVSAIGNMTDSLAGMVSNIGGVEDQDYAEVISMGERMSARLLCSALRSLKTRAQYFDPASVNWPIITDSNFRHASPNAKRTKMLIKKHLEPILANTVPVVCGFLGRDENGRTTTLGRGGSDTTALLIANCLEADEVILVKETEGVLSADPNIVSKARLIRKLDVHEMFALALGGAKIIRAGALKYKLPDQKLRVVSFSSPDISCGGTEITGSFDSNSAEIKVHRNLSAISVVCEVNSENLREFFSALGQRAMYGICTGKKSITAFVSSENLKETINCIHKLGSVIGVSAKSGVGAIEVNHPDFIDSPGCLAKICDVLSLKNINIIEVTTSKATISVFVDEKKLKEASEALGEVI